MTLYVALDVSLEKTDPPRDETPRRGGAGHRPYQGRTPHLSEGPRRRPHQCRARRRRLQLRAPPALAGEAFTRAVPGARDNLTEGLLGLKNRRSAVLQVRLL